MKMLILKFSLIPFPCRRGQEHPWAMMTYLSTPFPLQLIELRLCPFTIAMLMTAAGEDRSRVAAGQCQTDYRRIPHDDDGNVHLAHSYVVQLNNTEKGGGESEKGSKQ